MRTAHIEDLPQRLEVLESFLQRPMRDELRPMLLRMIVSTCRELGDFEAVTFYGEEALRANPSDGGVLIELTAAYAEAENPDLDRGIDYAKRAMKALDVAAEQMGEKGESRLAPYKAFLLNNWGWLLYRRGEVDQAEMMLVEASNNRKEPRVYIRLGTLRKDAGRLSDAKDDFAMALALSAGENPEARSAIEEIIATEGGAEADLEAIVEEKRREIANMKVEAMAQQSRVEPKPAPAFKVTTLDGAEVSLDELRDSVVVLDFWATWCGPCRRELPMVQKTYEDFKEKNVAVLAVSVDSDTSAVRPYAAKHNLTLPIAFGRELGGAYGASSIPMLVVIDGRGQIRYVHTGYHPDLEEVLPEEIKGLLEEL
jgi:peroxiredoxin